MYWHIDTDFVALVVIGALLIYNTKMQKIQEETLRNRRFDWNNKENKYLWILMRGTMVDQPGGEHFVYVSYYDVSQETTIQL